MFLRKTRNYLFSIALFIIIVGISEIILSSFASGKIFERLLEINKQNLILNSSIMYVTMGIWMILLFIRMAIYPRIFQQLRIDVVSETGGWGVHQSPTEENIGNIDELKVLMRSSNRSTEIDIIFVLTVLFVPIGWFSGLINLLLLTLVCFTAIHNFIKIREMQTVITQTGQKIATKITANDIDEPEGDRPYNK